MPVVRVDNTPPDASIEALETALGAVTQCGYLELPVGVNRWTRFRITAHDSEGHMLRYSISGTRGKNATAAGTTVTEERPLPSAHWEGVADQNVDFQVSVLPLDLAACPAVAYNFELHVYGSPTNCYSSWVESQHVKREVNLVIVG